MFVFYVNKYTIKTTILVSYIRYKICSLGFALSNIGLVPLTQCKETQKFITFVIAVIKENDQLILTHRNISGVRSNSYVYNVYMIHLGLLILFLFKLKPL